MAIAFGIFAILFSLVVGFTAAGAESDRRAVPFVFALSLAFLAASVALGLR